MTETDFQEMFRMVKEIHHHLGLDGSRIVSMDSINKEGELKILKWKERQAKKEHERAALGR